MKIIKYFVILFIGVAILSSCEKLNEPKLITDAQVGFENSSSTLMLDYIAGLDVNTTVKVMLIGPHQSSAITLNVGVDAASTAVEGTHFDLGATTVTIPANSSFGEFTLIGHANAFTGGGQSANVVLSLTAAGGVPVAPNFATTTTKLQTVCPFNINAFIGEYSLYEAGYSGSPYNTVITLDPVVENRIWITNFWDWTTDLAYFDFNPTTGVVTMPSQVITMGDGADYTCYGTGTYDPCEGTFHMTYEGSDVDGTVHDFIPGAVTTKSTSLGKRGM